jgi:hypothetical protein
VDEGLHPPNEPLAEELPVVPDVVPPRDKFTGDVDNPVNAGRHFGFGEIALEHR